MRTSFRLIFLFIISSLYILQVNAQTLSIDLEMHDATLKEIVKEIEQKSNYSFVFNENLNMQRRKDISIYSRSIPQVLELVFGGTEISWQIVDTHIILNKAKKITISGYVTEQNSMETLIGATIVDKRSNTSSISNPYGYYSIQVFTGAVQLDVSYIGFKALTKNISVNRDTVINFQLQEESALLQSVTVYNRKALSRVGNTIELSDSEIQSTATTFGENDVLKALQTMPGMSAGFEGSGGMFVRGGSPDQNLILLDGIPIYNTGHMANLFSVLNGDAIKKVTLYKNNFPARFGGRLSSVIDIRLKDGDMQQFHGNFTVGLYTARFNVEGPIIKGKTSYSLSTRRSYIDSFLRIARKTDSFVPIFYMYDINAKVNHKFSDKSRVYFSIYSGRDRQENIYEYVMNYNNYYTSGVYQKQSYINKRNYSWGNDIMTLRWNYVFNNNLFINTSLAYNQYKYRDKTKTDLLYEEYSQGSQTILKSGVKDWQFSVDLDYQMNNDHYVRFGGSVIAHQFNPETHLLKLKKIENTQEDWISKYYLQDKINGREMSLYGEDELSLSEHLKANLGLHFSIFNVQGKTYVGGQPRLAVSYQLLPKLILNSSYSKMNQYVNLLSSNLIGGPTDLWVPITKKVKPMSSHQFTTGLFFDTQTGYKMSIEGFYKMMYNLLDYKDGIAWKDVFTSWEENIESGKGRVYGLELLVQKTQSRFTGQIGYTLSWNDRQFTSINRGQRFPYKYDSRHNIRIATTYRCSNKVDISASWVYSTGVRTTLPLEQYQPLPQLVDGNVYNTPISYVGERYNYRLSDTHHLDVDLKYSYSPQKLWTFGIYNVYNRFNPYTIDVRYSSGNTITEKALLGIIPSASFTYKFR